MTLYDQYIDYFINIINEKNIEPKKLFLDNLESLRNDGESKKSIESLDALHMNLYRKRGYRFLDYFNYRRCIEYNLPLDRV